MKARRARSVLLGVFVLAFAVRLAWILRVQHPLDAVYSDMDGYVNRAEGLLAGKTPAEPRILALYPWGTHAILALEFWLFGRKARVAIAVVHALVGAVPAPAMAALSLRLIPSLVAAALVGTLVALWYPQVCFAGFFLSEVWFSAAIAAQAALTARPWKRPSGRIAAGLLSALAFVVRPQFILTWSVDTLAHGLSAMRRGGLRSAVRAAFWLSLPVALAVGGSAVRLHALAGHWGMISENDQMTRIWAETDVCRLESTWRTPNGETWSYWFSPPSKPARKPSDTAKFTGYIADPDILRRIRAERVKGVPWTDRLARRYGNLRLLVAGNLPWPESNYKKEPEWRGELMLWFQGFALAGIGLSVVGLVLGRKNHTMLVVAANLGTLFIAAAFYFGEARYRTPYDPFIILMSVVGGYELSMLALTLVGRVRSAIARSGGSPSAGLR